MLNPFFTLAHRTTPLQPPACHKNLGQILSVYCYCFFVETKTTGKIWLFPVFGPVTVRLQEETPLGGVPRSVPKLP